ncbi:hypothetical protein CYMTET_39083 [Cymbomonas tetramitiformis]|uniref:Uncharacterized protein n=1 Tax=Cymbomonas tetramitiformis TaxID=36881 RepID=A0AAE0CC41_9CHLO|nr:hypothetical protein CYMTET_39083 [Cymbomonas tetramitiformis]
MPPNNEPDELAGSQTLPSSIVYDSNYVDPFEQNNNISCPLVSAGKREKKSSTLWTICPFILGNEFCERLAYYGLATNLVVYLQLRCGFSASEAATQTSNWSGTCYVTPLIGAWLADSYFGRFKTIAIFTFIYLIGMVTLCIHPAFLATKDHESPEPLHQFAFFLGLYIVALGTGGIKPNVSAFGADQFDEQDPQDMAEKKSFFNWFYFAINLGSLLASLVVVYIQENISWTIGFAIPAVALAVASFMFWAGRYKYKFSQPKESPLERLMKIMWTATIAPRSREVEGDAFEEGSWVDRWLDRAVQCGKYTVAQVLEVKLVVRLMPVFFTQIMYWAVYTQMSTVFVEQGEQMNRKVVGSFAIPAASLSTFDTVSIIVLVPIFDGFVYPMLERSGYRLTPLRKIGWGMLFAVFSMLCAAAVEYRRLQVYHEGHTLDSDSSHKTSVDMTVFWQTGQYLLVGASEVMASIAQ